MSYIDGGHGKQTVVMLHGLAASKDAWRDLMGELPPGHWHTLAPDLLGFGDSPKPQWNKYTVQDHANAVLALIKQRGISGPIVIVGHSMGCLVAVHIAAARPRLVSRLVLHEPPLLGDIPEFPGHGKRSARYKALFEYIAAHPELAHVENKLMWRVARKLSGLYLSQEEWYPFEQSLRNTILNQQTYHELKEVAVPTDIIYGRLDLVVIRQGIEQIFRANKNINLHLVTDMHGVSTSSARYLAGLVTRRAKN